MAKKTAIINLLDNFIPAAIRNKRDLPREELVRTRAMLAILGISIIVPLLLLIAYISLQLVTGRDFSKDIYIVLAVEIILLTQHIYFQSYGNLRITAGVYSLQFFLFVAMMVTISGGLRSSILLLLVCSPMVAYMSVSFRAAIFHIAAVMITVTGLALMYLKGLDCLDISEKGNFPYTMTLSWIVTLLMLCMFMLVFEELVSDKK
jgi:hypothetical protein